MHIQHNQGFYSNSHASLEIRADELHKFANLYIGLLQVCREFPLLDGLLHLGENERNEEAMEYKVYEKLQQQELQ